MIVYKGSGVLVIISRIKLKSIERSGVFKLNFIKIILKAVVDLNKVTAVIGRMHIGLKIVY